MALLICSNETNMTTFHDPNLRNEGTNLQEKQRKEICSEEWKLKQIHKRSFAWTVLSNNLKHKYSWTNECVLGSKSSPFVESRRPLFSQHGPGTVDCTLVLAWWWVHVSRFHHIYWGGDHRGNKAGAERRYKVARQIVCGEKRLWTKRLKSMNDSNQRAFVLSWAVRKPMSADNVTLWMGQ